MIVTAQRTTQTAPKDQDISHQSLDKYINSGSEILCAVSGMEQ